VPHFVSIDVKMNDEPSIWLEGNIRKGKYYVKKNRTHETKKRLDKADIYCYLTFVSALRVNEVTQIPNQPMIEAIANEKNAK